MPLVIAVLVTLFFCSASNASGVSVSDDPLTVCFCRLKAKYMPLMGPLSPEDLGAVEKAIGFSLPSELGRFYEEVSHLRFTGTEPARAHGGTNSFLCKLITRHYKSDDWVPFWDDGDGYYCINKADGRILFFSYVPDSVFGEESYLNLVEFLQSKFLYS